MSSILLQADTVEDNFLAFFIQGQEPFPGRPHSGKIAHGVVRVVSIGDTVLYTFQNAFGFLLISVIALIPQNVVNMGIPLFFRH